MIFTFLFGGRIKRFRNRQPRHNCGKRMKGQPGHGHGSCYPGEAPIRRSRRQRHLQCRRLLNECRLGRSVPLDW